MKVASSEILMLPSAAMAQVYDTAIRYAASAAPVFISGETGVGKEHLAQMIHHRSGRSGRLVTVNAACLSRQLAGSTLFGHRRGAFTGATDDRDGAFVAADAGTLFIDETAELDNGVQAELLRVLEEGVVCPLGANTEVTVDVRLITASCGDLFAAMRRGAFRVDLFHRIYVLALEVPSLRGREDDIAALVSHFLDNADPPRVASRQALAKLLGHHWPGNIRELRNTLLRACAVTTQQRLRREDIELLPTSCMVSVRGPAQHREIIAAFERHNRSAAVTARVLGIHRATVYRHLRQSQSAGGS